MRTSDVDILIVPGWSSSGPDHWQSRWERNLPTARRVEQDDWLRPDRDRWVGRLIEEAARSVRPPVLVAHSPGWPVTAGETFDSGNAGFAPLPMIRLPFPSALVSSSDDPYCHKERAVALALAWGARLIDAGAAGHINVASGHGPWPEGVLRFGSFLKGLNAI